MKAQMRISSHLLHQLKKKDLLWQAGEVHKMSRLWDESQKEQEKQLKTEERREKEKQIESRRWRSEAGGSAGQRARVGTINKKQHLSAEKSSSDQKLEGRADFYSG